MHVFPARAGMNRLLAHARTLPHRVPRPRGDEPGFQGNEENKR